MRTAWLTEQHELRIVVETAEAVVGDLWHWELRPDGCKWGTPIGQLAAAVRPGMEGVLRHWRADLVLRTDVPTAMRDPQLAELLADWLLRETAATQPLILDIWEGVNTDSVSRGRFLDD